MAFAVDLVLESVAQLDGQRFVGHVLQAMTQIVRSASALDPFVGVQHQQNVLEQLDDGDDDIPFTFASLGGLTVVEWEDVRVFLKGCGDLYLGDPRDWMQDRGNKLRNIATQKSEDTPSFQTERR